jgi:transposase
VDVNGLLLAVVVTAASIPDRDAAHRLLAALRASFSTIALVWADGGYLGRLLIWAKDVLTLTVQIIKRIPGATGFHVRPRSWVVERSFAWIKQAPPLRARLRVTPHPPTARHIVDDGLSVSTYWPIFVAAGIAFGVFLAARAAIRCHRRRQCVHDAISARADYEHRALMAGDVWRGTFGRYEPAPWWGAKGETWCHANGCDHG